MNLPFGMLFLALAASCSGSDLAKDHDHKPIGDHHNASLDRCEGIEFDAIAPDEKGTAFFFKGDHVWKGFHGPSKLWNSTFKELYEHHHPGHLDAAFRMHHKDKADDHDHVFFFLNNMVFSYYNHSLEKGYPKEINEVFTGIPDNLDAAVECPEGECATDSVIFFKEDKVYHFDIKTSSIKQKEWAHLPRCTSAFRWQERFYCFHGHEFTRFHPVTGEVTGTYPKDARSYFMHCPGFGHSNATRRQNCSHPHLDAITTDEQGKAYAFRGKWYMRLDNKRDGWHAFPIDNAWKEVHSNVDAVFSYDQKLYFIKANQTYIYKSGVHYTLIEGYPKSLKDELGIEGPVDAAFVCDDKPIAYIIQRQHMKFVDLTATPRVVTKEIMLPMNVDAATCDSTGVKVFVSDEFYQYSDPASLASKIRVEPQKTPLEIMGCFH